MIRKLRNMGKTGLRATSLGKSGTVTIIGASRAGSACTTYARRFKVFFFSNSLKSQKRQD